MTSAYVIEAIQASSQSLNQQANDAFDKGIRVGNTTLALSEGTFVIPKDYPTMSVAIQAGSDPAPFTLVYEVPAGANIADYQGKTVAELDALNCPSVSQLFPGVFTRQQRNHVMENGVYVPEVGAPTVRSRGTVVDAFKPLAVKSLREGLDAIAGRVFRISNVVEVAVPKYQENTAARMVKVGEFNFV